MQSQKKEQARGLRDVLVVDSHTDGAKAYGAYTMEGSRTARSTLPGGRPPGESGAVSPGCSSLFSKWKPGRKGGQNFKPVDKS